MENPVFISYHHYVEDASIVERYRGGELSPGEAAEFEAHFVDCQECRDRLILDQLFHRPRPKPAEFAQPQAPEPSAPPPAPAFGRGPGAVFTALARLSAPLQLAVFVLTATLLAAVPALLITSQANSARAASEVEIPLFANTSKTHWIPQRTSWIQLNLDPSFDGGVYQLSLSHLQGSTMIRTPDQMGPFSTVRFPATMLPSGDYVLNVSRAGKDAPSVKASFSFTLERQQD